MPSIDRLFDRMLATGASDLHLSVGYPPMLRLRGELVPQGDIPLDLDQVDALLDELLDPGRLERFHREGDLDFAHAYEDRARFRANYFYKSTGPAAVFRTIPTEILSADDLKLPASILRLAEMRAGLVLVTGPTGSGKSTTLAALIDHINRTRDAHILTIEDPVEFVHQPRRCLVTHREVGLDCSSFTEAIRSAGRENPDVVLVGELRGAETMRLALQMASYGILVFATVHTNSASSTVDRFINVFPAAQQQAVRGMLAESLAGIVAQQLLRRADAPGRIAVHEVLVGTTGVRASIREGKTKMLESLIQAGKGEGMQSMDQTLEAYVNAGTIDPLDALDRALDKHAFARVPKVAAALGDRA